MCRYKKTLMAKKAAALQSFQKCDVGQLAIPSTIAEDSEARDKEAEDRREASLGGSEGSGERPRLVFMETMSDTSGPGLSPGLVPGHLREPSDRIEIAVSPVR